LIDIDGKQKSGSGTILRLAVALSAIKREPLHIYNIRKNRPKPGLKPQHLQAVITAAKLCSAKIEGAILNSEELWFQPNEILGGDLNAEIGTAGNIPMLFLTILPICIYAKKKVFLRVTKGGTDTRQAPTINYLKHVLFPTLKKMGFETNLTVKRYGYYPKGLGEATLEANPTTELMPLRLENFGKLEKVKGVSIGTFLDDRKVAFRQAKAAEEIFAKKGLKAEIQILNDFSNSVQKGSSITLWAETDNDVIIGADAIGEINKTAEAVGIQAAEKLVKEIEAKATVDTHLADMLIPYMALAKDRSSYLTRKVSEHLETNIWLSEKILKASFNINQKNRFYQIQKMADN
jgi:RNA 3'-terminal phosphate cyclase (ATP)